MLVQKVRYSTDFQIIDIPYDDDSLYISPDKKWISGVCDSNVDLYDGETVYLSNDMQDLECIANTETVEREGYVLIKKSIKIYETKMVNFDGQEQTIHYINYKGRNFYEDLSSFANVGSSSPTNTITMYQGDNIRKKIQITDKDYVDVEEIIYIENGQFEYNGKIYLNHEDFNLETTKENGYGNFVQNIILEDGNIGEVHPFELEEYRKITKFKIEILTSFEVSVTDAYQVESYHYAYYKNVAYEILGEGSETYIETYDEEGNPKRVSNVSGDENYFVPEDETYLCTDMCKEKFFVHTNYRKSEKGKKLYMVLKSDYNIRPNDILHFQTMNNYNGVLYVDEIGDNEFRLFLNDVTYLSEKNNKFYIELDGTEIDIELTCLGDSNVQGYLIAYVNVNGTKNEIYVSGDYKTYKKYVANGEEFTWQEGEVKARASFFIDGTYYEVKKRETMSNTNEKVTLYYIEYNGKIYGDINIVEALGNKTYICEPSSDYNIEGDDDFNGISMQCQYIAKNYRYCYFSVGNSILNNISAKKGFIRSESDTESIWEELYQEGDSFSRIKITKRGNFLVFPILLQNGIGNNVLQEDTVTNDFYEVEREKSINSIIDMEKDVYHPCILSTNENIPQDLEEVTEIVFNLHLRTRDMTNWKINQDEGNDRNVGLTNWFITDYPFYFRNEIYGNYSGTAPTEIEWVENPKGETLDGMPLAEIYEKCHDELIKDWNRDGKNAAEKGVNVFEESDLLYFLKFTDDDIFYQKSKVANTFLRLSFYDSPDPKKQSLLHYSTIFLNEGDLFKKYLDNVDTRDGKEFVEVCRLGINNLSSDTITQFDFPQCSGDVKNTISVSREYVPNFGMESGNVDQKRIVDEREEKRLSCQFKVTNRYQTKDSSDGFYVYIFRDYSLPFTQRSIYMKVELNHAGLGKTLSFMYPRKFRSPLGQFDHLTLTHAFVGEGDDAKKYEIDPNNSYQVFDDENSQILPIESEPCQDISDFRDGYDLKDIYYQQYIEFKVIYDDINKRYCYYLPFAEHEYEDNENSPYRDKKMILNLWEMKIKNDLTETEE